MDDDDKYIDQLYADLAANPPSPQGVGARLVPGGQTQRDDSWFTGLRNNVRSSNEKAGKYLEEGRRARDDWMSANRQGRDADPAFYDTAMDNQKNRIFNDPFVSGFAGFQAIPVAGVLAGKSAQWAHRPKSTQNRLEAENAAMEPLPGRTDSFDEIEAVRQSQAVSDGLENAWFMGPDGGMRFEIDDSSALIQPEAMRDLLSTGKAVVNGKTVDYVPLPYFLAHKDLYVNYPELANVKVVLDNSPDRLGFFDHHTNTLGISKGQINTLLNGRNSSSSWTSVDTSVTDMADNIKDTILHEVQHWIQNKENFTQGSSTRYHQPEVALKLDNAEPEYLFTQRLNLGKQKSVIDAFDNVMLEHGYVDGYVDGTKTIYDDPNLARKILDSLFEQPTDRRGRTIYASSYTKFAPENVRQVKNKPGTVSVLSSGILPEDRDAIISSLLDNETSAQFIDLYIRNKMRDDAISTDPRSLYNKVLGEIEARAVGARRNLNESERIKTSPYASEKALLPYWIESPINAQMQNLLKEER